MKEVSESGPLGAPWPGAAARSLLSPSVDSDGAGRSGTYVLIDMVLNKMAKGETDCFVVAQGGDGVAMATQGTLTAGSGKK
jgi:hypothetical protein